MDSWNLGMDRWEDHETGITR